jgi:hypothetical protein
MTIKQVEDKMTELIHREPFVAFVVEMNDGSTVDVPHARVAFDDTGAVFIHTNGALVDFEFKRVRAIRLASSEAAA